MSAHLSTAARRRFRFYLGTDRPPPEHVAQPHQPDLFDAQVIGLHECVELADVRGYLDQQSDVRLAWDGGAA